MHLPLLVNNADQNRSCESTILLIIFIHWSDKTSIVNPLIIIM